MPSDGKKKMQEMKKFKGKTSKVWKFFTVLPENDRAKCLLCGTSMAYASRSTTSLRLHIFFKHKSESHYLLEDTNDHTSSSVYKSESADANLMNDLSSGIANTPTKPESKFAHSKPKSRTSWVWEFFNLMPSDKKAKCVLCNALLSYQATRSSANLRKHIIAKHKNEAQQVYTKSTSDTSDIFFQPEHVDINMSVLNDNITDVLGSLDAGATDVEAATSIQDPVLGTYEDNKKPSRAPFWKFVKIFAKANVAKCQLCGLHLPYVDKKTSLIRNHVTNKHSAALSRLAAMGDGYSLATYAQASPSLNIKMPSFSIPGPRKKVVLDEKIVEMLALDLLPVSFVDNKGFKTMMSVSHPGYAIPCKRSVSKELLPNMYKRIADNIMNELEGISNVALSTEMWSNQRQENFLNVTAHYICPKRWTTQSVLLATLAFIGTALSGSEISNELGRIVAEWNLVGKVTIMVADDQTNTLLANEQLPWGYIPCFGHLIHLVVMNALSEDVEAMTLIQKVNSVVIFFQHNLQAHEDLASAQRELNLPENKLIPSIPARWNSIFYMLERMHEQLNVVNTVLVSHGMQGKCLTDLDEQNMKMMISCMKPFEVAVSSLCDDESSCISVATPIVKGLMKMMATVTDAKEPLSSLLKDGLFLKFNKIEEIEWIATATLLDPRFKRYQFAEKTVLDKAADRVLSELSALIDLEQETTVIASNSSNSFGSFWDYLDTMTNNVDEDDKQGNETTSADRELQCYFDASPIPRTDSALFYWKQHQEVLPHLHKLAAKYLCVPITSVTAERLFTKAHDSFIDKASQIKAKHINMILFLNRNMQRRH